MYMACRSAERADEAIRAIRNGEVHGMDGKTHSDGQNGGEARPKGRLESLELDLADLRSVERFADDFIR